MADDRATNWNTVEWPSRSFTKKGAFEPEPKELVEMLQGKMMGKMSQEKNKEHEQKHRVVNGHVHVGTSN